MPKNLKFFEEWFRRAPKIFVIGTDTGVGKTWWSRELIRTFLKARRTEKILYLKPVETGSGLSRDTIWMKKKIGERNNRIDIRHILAFKTPASPHLAARLEKKTISFARLVRECRAGLSDYSHAVVEGAGGILTPLSENKTMLDLAEALGLPVLLVARAGLGTINHSLLTAQALKSRNLPIFGTVLNAGLPGPKNWNIVLDNAAYLSKRLPGGFLFPGRPKKS
ncbi:MAG: dethiobiotin synthase [Spirochaetia bacterium]|nr:dethiobiotin synthase [Spirochaetia bacterium]